MRDISPQSTQGEYWRDYCMDLEFENARPLNLQEWSERPEVDAVVDDIFHELRVGGSIKRDRNQRTCLKVILLNLYACYVSDPTQYVRYSRSNRSWTRRYNCLQLSAEQVRKIVDQLLELGYVSDKLGEWAPYEADRRQSRMRATEKLISRFDEFKVSPVMVTRHSDAETIIMKDEQKNLTGYEDTDETVMMRSQMRVINDLLSKTLINLYMSDADLAVLSVHMREGKEAASQIQPSDINLEKFPARAIDFTNKALCRVFNNGNFRHGGRLYGGWWQGIPRTYRKYIRINRMNTIEIDFSAMHINLIYWLQGAPVPDGGLYTLDGFPPETRQVVKKSLLTLINAKDRTKGMSSIREHINGVKIRMKKTVGGKNERVKEKISDDDRIILPPGIKIEEIISAFEEKHFAIRDWFFSGKGVELQYWDSQIAIAILLRLAQHGVPCLPLHDSFIVSHPQENGLRSIMAEAFHAVTGRHPIVDAKTSLIDENKERGVDALEAEYKMKMSGDGGTYSTDFTNNYQTYVSSIKDWKQVTGKSNIFAYGGRLSRETYND